MKFGVREICDVVLKAKSAQKIGKKIFYANEPVIYFDTLKTSSMEGAATTVYAQGGRGNSRLVAWEGERTVTFTMEDALISPEGFMILSGAGLIDSSTSTPIHQHITETVDASTGVHMDGENIKIDIKEVPFLGFGADDEGNIVRKQAGNFAYVMFVKDGEIISEPYIPLHDEDHMDEKALFVAPAHTVYDATSKTEGANHLVGNQTDNEYNSDHASKFVKDGALDLTQFDSVLVDYYTVRDGEEEAQQIEITADKFGGNYYLEASTLFRDQRGVDMPAEFIIPNCKIQSNFTFTMASSGDPSTFTFTMDAFPDYTRFDHSKKVLAAIQIIKNAGAQELHRHETVHEAGHDELTW